MKQAMSWNTKKKTTESEKRELKKKWQRGNFTKEKKRGKKMS